MPKKINSGPAMSQGRMIYMLELVRGSSHIASTCKPETLDLAIREVLEEFRQLHGLPGLRVFRELLAQDVDKRGNIAAAFAVRDFSSTKWSI